MRHLLLLSALALALCAGCSTLSSPAPDPTTPQTDDRVVAINSAGDLGGLGCGVLATELKPDELVKARRATAAAQAMLTEVPSFGAIGEILNESGLPPRYALLSAVLLQRVRVRVGQADLIPVNSTGFAMVQSYLNACAAALNAFPVAALSTAAGPVDVL